MLPSCPTTNTSLIILAPQSQCSLNWIMSQPLALFTSSSQPQGSPQYFLTGTHCHHYCSPTLSFPHSSQSLLFIYFFKIWNASRICVSSLRRGHANLLCIVPVLVYVLPKRAPESFKNLIMGYFLAWSIG